VWEVTEAATKALARKHVEVCVVLMSGLPRVDLQRSTRFVRQVLAMAHQSPAKYGVTVEQLAGRIQAAAAQAGNAALAGSLVWDIVAQLKSEEQLQGAPA
jgi:hypothetical protein